MGFSIRINRRQNIDGELLASMNQTDAVKYFSGIKGKDKKRKLSDDQIKKAHTEALVKAKELKTAEEAKTE